MTTLTNSTDLYGVAQLIVDQSPGYGNYTTIAAALAAAVSGQTIFIRPGTYTENLTLIAGINITAFEGDANTPNVIINGTCTASFQGSCSISNIFLQTNSAPFLTVSDPISGPVTTLVNLNNCFFNILNNTGISFTSTSSTSRISINYCLGNIATTGITFCNSTSSGIMFMLASLIRNLGNSTTLSNFSVGGLNLLSSYINFGISTSGTGALTVDYSVINTSAINTIAITSNGTATNSNINGSTLFSGSASAVSIGMGNAIVFADNVVITSNPNTITGAGTINYSGTNYGTSSFGINTTTVNRGYFDGGQYVGTNTNTTLTAGVIGEQIRSAIAIGSAITLSNTVVANVTSISLTPGIWDVTGIVSFSGTLTGTAYSMGLGKTSASFTGVAFGDNGTTTPTSSTATSDNSLTVPVWRLPLSVTTPVYLLALADFTVGTALAYGRISATRVA